MAESVLQSVEVADLREPTSWRFWSDRLLPLLDDIEGARSTVSEYKLRLRRLRKELIDRGEPVIFRNSEGKERGYYDLKLALTSSRVTFYKIRHKFFRLQEELDRYKDGGNVPRRLQLAIEKLERRVRDNWEKLLERGAFLTGSSGSSIS